jgi:hypothetical protein
MCAAGGSIAMCEARGFVVMREAGGGAFGKLSTRDAIWIADFNARAQGRGGAKGNNLMVGDNPCSFSFLRLCASAPLR